MIISLFDFKIPFSTVFLISSRSCNEEGSIEEEAYEIDIVAKKQEELFTTQCFTILHENRFVYYYLSLIVIRDEQFLQFSDVSSR